MTQLQLDNLPNLRQIETLCRIAPAVWEHKEVMALWVIGSVARGEGDAYSDIDMGVAVTPESLDGWRERGVIEEIFGGACVGRAFIPFGDDAFLWKSDSRCDWAFVGKSTGDFGGD